MIIRRNLRRFIVRCLQVLAVFLGIFISKKTGFNFNICLWSGIGIAFSIQMASILIDISH